jgi:hypothetical protein
MDIANDRRGNWVEKVRRDGRVVVAFDLVRAKIRIDVRFWVAERLLPEYRQLSKGVYGDV